MTCSWVKRSDLPDERGHAALCTKNPPTLQLHTHLGGVDLIVLAFAAVDGFHVQSVAEDESDLLPGAEIGKPVPAEQALDGDDAVVAEGSDSLEEGVGFGGEVFVVDDLAVAIEDAQVHGAGVQIDAAVETVLLVVEAHG
jgi:hypothetical protein